MEVYSQKIFREFLVILVFLFFLIVVFPNLFLLNNKDDFLLFLFFVLYRILSFFVLFHVLGYWFFRLIGKLNKYNLIFEYSDEINKTHKNVSIIVPIRDEPVELIKRMLYKLKEIDYDNYSIYLINNGSTPSHQEFNDLLDEIELKAFIILKNDCVGFKAGALNMALAALRDDTEYVLVLDIDHAPRPHILKVLVPVLENDQSLGFVQAPQRYSDIQNSIISFAYCFKQKVFYDHMCTGMSETGALFCFGTNVLFRKSALDDVGGFDEYSLTEDVRTSVHLQQKGWIGKYYSGTVADGFPPFDFYSYCRQQRRWAIGTFQNLYYSFKLFISNKSLLSGEQWMIYLGWNGLYYFQGLSCLLMIFISIIFFNFNIVKYTCLIDSAVFLVSFLTIISIVEKEKILYTSTLSSLFLMCCVFFSDFVVYSIAFVEFIFKNNFQFEVTRKKIVKSNPVPLLYLFLYIFFAIIISVLLLIVPSSSYWVKLWAFLYLLQLIGIIYIIISEILKIKNVVYRDRNIFFNKKI